MSSNNKQQQPDCGSRDGFEIFTSATDGHTVDDYDESVVWLRAHAEPVLITAAQWFPSRALEGWERLWLRVLVDAILEYAATWMDPPPDFRRMASPAARISRRAKVLAWFRGRGRAPISFADIVDYFGIRVGRVWGVLGEIEKAGLQAA